MKFRVAIDEGTGFNTWQNIIEANTLDKLLLKLKGYAACADDDSFLSFIGSTQEPPGVWEAIEECWECYVIPAIEQRAHARKIELVEQAIAVEETWLANLEATKAQKQQFIQEQLALLKTLKESQ